MVRRLAAVLAVSLAAVAVLAAPVQAGTVQTQSAVNWIRTKQQPDGGFEVAGFPGFETPDAVLAIAENAQTSAVWSETQARTAVQAVKAGGTGPNALQYLDDFASSGINAGQAAKLIVLVTEPLGLSSTAFDPRGNGAVNLVGTMDSGYSAGSYGELAATLYAAIANAALGRPVPAQTVTLIRSAQQANGGWNYGGDPSGDYADVDTTGLAIMALVASGLPKTHLDITQGVAYLAANYSSSGGWESFGSFSPNSTAVGMMALTAAGVDFSTSAWKGGGGGYVTPTSALLAYQQPSGEFPAWGNTFGTSQAVQGLLRGWLPLEPAPSGDVVSVKISGGADVSGALTSGDIRIIADGLGVVSVGGSGTVADDTGPASVTFGIQRLWFLPVYTGQVAADGWTAQIWFSGAQYASATRTASGASSWFDFSRWPWTGRSVAWSVRDGA